MTEPLLNRDLLATCWTWAGDAAPLRGDERSPHSIQERVAAVGAAGWQGVGLAHADLMTVRDSMGYRGLHELLAEAGITHIELEFISHWWTEGPLRTASDRVRRDLFAAAAALGVSTIKVSPELQSFGVRQPVDHGRFMTEFDALATDAGKHGLQVALEPMPMSNLRTITAGADLVREVANPHGGLVVDTWHVARGGTDYERLPEILPVEHVFIVELDDADAEVVGTLWDDTIDRRRRPGDGDLDLPSFVTAMHHAGWRGHWGVEILSEEQRRTPLDEAVRTTRSKALAVLDAAELLLAGP